MTDGCGNLQCEQSCFHSADLRLGKSCDGSCHVTSSQLAGSGGQWPPVHCDAWGPGQDRPQEGDGAHPQEAGARLLRLRGQQAGVERQEASLVPGHGGPSGAILCSCSRWRQVINILSLLTVYNV